MLLFRDFIENMNEQMSLGEEIDPKLIVAIRAGLNISPNFWEDFLTMCNNPYFPSLLGLRKEIIGQWPKKIREALAYIERFDSEQGSFKKSKVITTGY